MMRAVLMELGPSAEVLSGLVGGSFYVRKEAWI